MKDHKILVTGRLKASIDDFFYHTTDDFEILSTSLRTDDIINHLNVFKPDAFVICLGGETTDDLNLFVNIRPDVEKNETPVFIIGSADACAVFLDALPFFVRESFVKPIAIEKVRDGIIRVLNSIRIEKEQEEAKKEEERKKQEEEQKQAEEYASHRHILVIDDDPLMLRVVKEQLRDIYDVAAAVNGRIAYKFLASRKPDLILLDYEMPIENGKVVFEKIRQMNGMEEVPIIFLTGVNDSERIKDVLALNPQGYLLKPIERNSLIEVINKNLK
ncbi:MAG: response regulator [Lachnospiraceae bacterium]|nr:response regulator [Lachnospiraceae bacterium]